MCEPKKNLVLGIGCRKGKSSEEIQTAVLLALKNLSIHDVRLVTSIDTKTEEQGLLDFCQQYNLPVIFFSKGYIKTAIEGLETSEWVYQKVGVEAVCEPCALAGSINGELIVSKFVHQAVTVAIARDRDDLGVIGLY